MGTDFGAAMRQALQLVRSQNGTEATRVIQRALANRGGDVSPADDSREPGLIPLPSPDVIETKETVKPTPQQAHEVPAGANRAGSRRQASGRPRRPLGEVVKQLRQVDLAGLGRGAQLLGFRKAPAVPVPEGAAYLQRSFACAAGARDCKVYVPASAKAGRLPLIVMLHGCMQIPDDFAVERA